MGTMLSRGLPSTVLAGARVGGHDHAALRLRIGAGTPLFEGARSSIEVIDDPTALR